MAPIVVFKLWNGNVIMSFNEKSKDGPTKIAEVLKLDINKVVTLKTKSEEKRYRVDRIEFKAVMPKVLGQEKEISKIEITVKPLEK